MAGDQPNDPDTCGSLRLTTFGEPSLSRGPEDGESESVLGPGKPLCVLIYLAFSPDKSATRDHLIDLLWANLDLDSARHALRQALWYLRRELGEDAIRSRGPELQLLLRVDSDRDRFMKAIERRDFEEAVDLYRGEFLPMFAAPGGADFEKWADAERYRMKTHFIRAGQAVVQMRLQRAEFEEAKRLAVRMRDADPLSQSAWRLLLETLLTADDPARARIEAHAMEQEFSEFQRELEPPLRRLLRAARAGFYEASPDRKDTVDPELIGRQREFATILSAWREARAGRGRAIHVSGGAGLGKSRLLAEVEARLRTMGARTVLVRAHPGERELRYSLVSELAAALAALPGHQDLSEGAARVLVALNPDLTNAYDVTPDASTGKESLRRRALVMHSLLTAVAGREPVAVLIDDVHWADPASRQVLRSLRTRLSETPTLILTTGRPESLGDPFPHMPEEQLVLETLSTEEVRRLLASLGTLPATAWGDALPDAMHVATGGSPLLVIETLRLALSEGWLSLSDGAWECWDPESLEAELKEGRALSRRVESLPDRVFRLLLLLCVAGRPLNTDRLARTSERNVDSVEKELRDLEIDGLAVRIGDSWRVAHDEIASAVLEAADDTARVESHGSLGRSLAEGAIDDPHDLLRAGRHLATAGDLDALQSVFVSWVAAQRDQGDRRPMDRMVSEFLPVEHRGGEAERSIRRLPLSSRLGLVPIAHKRLVAAVVLVAMLLVGAAMMTDRSTAPDAELLVFRGSAGGSFDGSRLPVSRRGWESQGPLRLDGEAEPIPSLQGLPRTSSLAAGPPGRGLAYGAPAPDSGGTEVFLRLPEGRSVRLTHSPGDDVPVAWAPDGSSLLFQTSRWGDTPWHHLAVLNLQSGEIRRLVEDERREDGFAPDEGSGQWSLDGTRIAFITKFNATQPTRQQRTAHNELCWATVDGSTRSCFSPEKRVQYVIGWSDTWEVLVLATDSSENQLLERIDLQTGESDVVVERADRAAMSPDGEWLATLRPATSGMTRGWYVAPVGRPNLAVPLVAEERGLTSVVWSFTDNPEDVRYLDRLDIHAPDTVPLGVPVKLRARGIDSQGRPIGIPVLSWGLPGSENATLDPASGVLVPRRPTDLTIYASAGGWRRDTVHIAVRPAAANTLFSEDWEADLTNEWIPFGEPVPTLAQWPDGGQAYWNRSDDSFNSGAYSRRAFRAHRGPLGMEASVSTPRTAPRAQDLYVSILAWTEPAAVEEWDHRTGGPPGSPVCSFKYPAGDGYDNLRRARIGPAPIVQIDSVVPTGEPYALRLQLFSDHSCGVALNGKPLARVDAVEAFDAPYRVVLTGKSVGTKLLVDDLEVWEGVRGGVDWSVIDDW